MITAIAIDDEPLALKIVSHFCGQINFIDLQKTFTKTDDALQYLEKNNIELLFLDIQMPGRTGIDFYKQVGQDVMVIFTTAYTEYAVEGFNVNAVDYLLKPFSFDRFLIAADKAVKEKRMRENVHGNSHLVVRADYKQHRIDFSDILLIEGLDDYIRIHLKGKTPITARFSMKNIIEKLPDTEFVRVHRSYIIPIRKIKSIFNKTVPIEDFIIPIGDTCKDALTKCF